MRKILSIILLALICLTSSAEVVTLRSGQQVRGEILMKNAEVVIIKTDNGARFQYPMTEVLRIEEEVEEPVVAEEVRTEPLKPVSARIFLAGGAGYVPNEKVGGSVLVDVAIGTRNLAGKRIFLGGSIGYAGFFSSMQQHFVPLQAVVSVPLMDGKHAPEISASLGYGFGTKGYKGGIAAGLQLLWRYQFSPRAAFLLGGFARFQQGQKEITETLHDKDYTRNVGAVYILSGVSMGIAF